MTRAAGLAVWFWTSSRTSVAVSQLDRKSTRLNSSHQIISYAVFCLQKKKCQRKQVRGVVGAEEPQSLTCCSAAPCCSSFLIAIYWCSLACFFFFFNDTATTEIYTLSLHDALPIFTILRRRQWQTWSGVSEPSLFLLVVIRRDPGDRKSTRLNSSHQIISYAVF